MKLLIQLALRNLLRQKRRNLMLGTAIAFGMMILVIANSFANGVSDIMFNKIVAYVAGHVSINSNEGSGKRVPVFRDKERLYSIVKSAPEYIEDIDESIGVFLRAIGNGRTDNLIMVGVDTTKNLTPEQKKEFDESFQVTDGNMSDLGDTKYPNAVIISGEKARSLNVKKGDLISVRFRNLYGQNQSARMTVVGIMSNANTFMQGVMFGELRTVKELMGYSEHDCPNLQILVKDPARNAVTVADRLHALLKPDRAFIAGTVSRAGATRPATLLPFMADADSRKRISDSFRLVSGSMDDVQSRDGVMIPEPLARSLGLRIGSEFNISFQPKFQKEPHSFTAEVAGIYAPDASTGDATVFMQESIFYKHYYPYLPDQKAMAKSAFLPPETAAFAPALGKEWVLLERTSTTDDWKKKFSDVTRKKIRAATVDVSSMYETASDVLKLEGALNLITFAAVLVLFFIILIGVVNTLRMTIRERTREIGTIRAIGMQQRDVRTVFLLETGFLTLFAALAGTISAFAIMGLLSLINIPMEDNPLGMLLVNESLHFVPTLFGIAGNIAAIMLIAILTAFFPARRASRLNAADALRHYE